MFEKYSGKKIIVTGHTGFKGSWLVAWLESLNAEVLGYSLKPETDSHFNKLELKCKNVFANINDEKKLVETFKSFSPDIVFHLAAQPLVRQSYIDPIETYETNVLGSLKVYRASLLSNVKAVVSITTDKVYENLETAYAYKEDDRLGGYDPYSSSKACMEIMTDSFKRSFLTDSKMLIATVRAGNVIGGGDWAKDRIVPDLIRTVDSGSAVTIRNPASTRPWQHVLEPLCGYLLVGEKLLAGEKTFERSFNFGPPVEENFTVGDVCQELGSQWPEIKFNLADNTNQPHEAKLLKLNTDLAKTMLNWKPRLTFSESLSITREWYQTFIQEEKVITRGQINLYSKLL